MCLAKSRLDETHAFSRNLPLLTILPMNAVIWIIFGLLFVLHHDFWWWNDPTLVWGVPVGLAWHCGYSVAASLLWLAAIRYAWPAEQEEWAEQSDAQ